MADERKYIARLELRGADQVKRESEAAASSVEQSSRRMEGAWAKLGSTADGLDSGLKKINRGVGDARGAIELLGGVIPGLDTAFGGLSRTIGNLADVFGTVASLALRNPLGVLAVGVSAAAAAYVYFNQTADSATAAVSASGAGARTAAADWAKLVDPLKTVGQLIDEIKAKQVAAVGGPRGAVDLALAQRRRELADAEAQIAAQQAKPFRPGISNAETAQRRDQDQAAADRIRALRPEIDKLQREIAQLEAEQRRLDEINNTFRPRPGEDGNNLEGFRRTENDRAAFARERAEAGRRAALEEQRAIDQLIASYAPASKAATDYAAARDTAQRAMRDGKISAAQYEEVLRSISQAEFDATEAGREQARIRQFAGKVTEEVKTGEERYAQALRDTAEAERLGLISSEQATRKRQAALKELENSTGEAAEEAKRNKDIARELGLTFQSAFEDAIVRGRKFGDVLKGITEDIARLIVRFTITIPLARALSEAVEGIFGGGKDPKSGAGGGLIGGLLGGLGKGLGSLFDGIFSGGTVLPGDPTGGQGPSFLARGGVLQGGELQAFARGGVVDRPVLFPMARGAGLMGEAGPEAIMPLRRGPGGRLGVEVNGGASAAPLVLQTSIDARGADKMLRDQLPRILRDHRRETIAEIGRLNDRGGSFARKSGRRSA